MYTGSRTKKTFLFLYFGTHSAKQVASEFLPKITDFTLNIPLEIHHGLVLGCRTKATQGKWEAATNAKLCKRPWAKPPPWENGKRKVRKVKEQTDVKIIHWEQ